MSDASFLAAPPLAARRAMRLVQGVIAICILTIFLGWPIVLPQLDLKFNREDRWIITILMSLPLTGARVVVGVAVATIIALPLAVLAGRSAYGGYHRIVGLSTLFAAIPLVVWVYIIIAVPLGRWSNGREPMLAALCAALFPLILAFSTSMHAAFGSDVANHARQLGANVLWQVYIAARIATPYLLEAIRLTSLIGWSVVLFAETQVALQRSQGLGTTLGIWARNGVASLPRVAFGCIAVCVVALLLAQALQQMEQTLRERNGISY